MVKHFARIVTLLFALALTACSTGNSDGLPLPGFGDTLDPTLAVAGITEGATVSGTVAISAAATDNVGVTAFTLSIDGAQVASAANGAIAYSWVTTGATNAAHTLVFTASDAAGNSATTTLHANVDNAGGGGGGGGADTEDPVVAVAGIANGATVLGTIYITASANDNVGVTALTLQLDGTEVATSATGALKYTFNTPALTNAAHSLVFTASDAAGNSAIQTLNVTVANPTTTGTVSGTVFAPNGSDPVSGALVFVQNSSASAIGDPPEESYISYGYSDAAGHFSLTGVPLGNQSLKFLKGAFFKVITVNVVEGDNVLGAVDTTLPSTSEGGAGEMLVVTGDFDSIENVLAKLGLGDIDGSGQWVPGTEQFHVVDGDASLPDGDYQNFDQWRAVQSNWDDYRTIFLNCGNHYEAAFFADSAAMARLKAWVEGGGRLYCTDWSYDFIEQVWAEKIDFDDAIASGDGLSTAPEQQDNATTGLSMSDLLCHIEDAGLASWMSGIGASSPGDNFNTVDWLSAWVPMDAVAATGVKVWATGTPPGDASRPMTVTFNYGAGTVLFSSYHTEETPSLGLTPQERVLQYLIFEVL